LLDPEHALIDVQRRALQSDAQPDAQLIGIEFFGINRYVRNLLDIATIQWWAVVRTRATHDRWRLDKTNPSGESLQLGAEEYCAYLVSVNGRFLGSRETNSLYGEIRNREFGWLWYERHKLGWRQVVDTLQRTADGIRPTTRLGSICAGLGLLTKAGMITELGASAVRTESAADRRDLTFHRKAIRHAKSSGPRVNQKHRLHRGPGRH